MQQCCQALADVVEEAQFENIGCPFFQAILEGSRCPLCFGSPQHGGLEVTSTVGVVHVCNQKEGRAGAVTNCGAGVRVTCCGDGDDEKMEGLSQFHVAKVNFEKRKADDDAEKPKKKIKKSKKKKNKRSQDTVEVKALQTTGHRIHDQVGEVRVRYSSLCGTAGTSHWIAVDKVNGDESMDAIVKDCRKTNLKAAKEVRLGAQVCDISEEHCKSDSRDCEVMRCCMHSLGCRSYLCDGCVGPSCVTMCKPCVDADHVDENNDGMERMSKGTGTVIVCGSCLDRCVVCTEQGMRHDESADVVECSQCELGFKDNCGDQGRCNICAPCRICGIIVPDGDDAACLGCSRRTHVGCCPFVDSLPQHLKRDANLSTMAGCCADCIGRCGTCYEEVSDKRESCSKCSASICDDCVGHNLLIDGLCITCAHHRDVSGDVEADKRQVFTMVNNAFTDVMISADPSAVRSCLVLLQGTIKSKSWAWR